MTTAIRVLIADDSAIARLILRQGLSQTPAIGEIITANDGLEAIQLAVQYKPDIVLMDVEMPEMDGYEATRWLMKHHPLPILVITNLDAQAISLRMLEIGAIDVLNKPQLNRHEQMQQMIRQVQSIVAHYRQTEAPNLPPSPQQRPPTLHLPSNTSIVGIAASTGGPRTISKLFQRLIPPLPWPIVVTQHISEGFSKGLAQWLNNQTSIPVELAKDHTRLQTNHIYIAPDNRHMEVHRGLIHLRVEAPEANIRPSANVLFASIAHSYGSQAIAIVLTGMGEDGKEGARLIRQRGGLVIAQEESECIVYGMPRAIVEAQLANMILTTDEIAFLLNRASSLSQAQPSY